MTTFISDTLMVAAVVGGPVLLGLLYVYGIRATHQKDKNPHSRDVTETATRDLYEQSDDERERQEKAAAGSKKIIDVIERKTGTTG
jgi:hypothetical protein